MPKIVKCLYIHVDCTCTNTYSQCHCCIVEDAVMTLTVNVDEDTAPALNNGHDLLEDILVLHLEKGKDFFITVSGNYLPSCFGSSLETLVHLHTYIREVPVAQLVDLVCTVSSTNWQENDCVSCIVQCDGLKNAE